MTAFSPAALDYFTSHAIDPRIAAELNVGERDGFLIYTVHRPECGGWFQRKRGLNGTRPKTIQPPGQPLSLWWPQFPWQYAPVVLLVEGESDALAAETALATRALHDRKLPVVAIPGTGFPVERVVAEMQRVEAQTVYTTLDADAAGRSYTERLGLALREVGIRALPVELPEGRDLSEVLAGCP